MRRFALALAILAAVLSSCSGAPPPVPTGPTTPGDTAPPTPPVVPPTPPLAPAAPSVRTMGEDLEINGLKNVGSVVWAPSGNKAVVQDEVGFYLLETAGPSLAPLPAFDPVEPPTFWSENELLWLRDGLLKVRDLASGKDRLVHNFGAHVIHFLRPSDTHYVVNQEQGVVQQGYRFGAIVSGSLGKQDETKLIELGHLIGRMRDGQVLAVEGYRQGPLWSITATGEKTLLSKDPAYFVQISPDGKRALWLTGRAVKSSWLDLFKPAIAHADPPYDPPLTDLWTWDGSGAPVQVPLSGTFSARAEFSPDGNRIALSLNPGFVGPGMNEKPGQLAVLEGGKIRPLATFEGWVGLGMWLGNDGFRFMPPMEGKTGAQAPILRIDLSGEQSTFSGGIWYDASTREGDTLILNWHGDFTTVHWRGSSATAQVSYHPGGELGYPLYVPPSAPYLPFHMENGLRLIKLRLK